jgi:hypothetical protein
MVINPVNAATYYHTRELASAQYALRTKRAAKAETETHEEKEFLLMLEETHEIKPLRAIPSLHDLKMEPIALEKWENNFNHCSLLHLNHAFCV